MNLMFKFRRKEQEKPIYVLKESISTNALTNKAIAYIKSLSETGPRIAASRASRMAANKIASYLSEFTDSVEKMEVDIDRSRAWLWTKVISILLPLSSLFLLFGLPYIALLVEAFSLYVFYCDALLSKGVFSRFVKPEKGENVKAVIGEEKERKVILTCHHDSAYLYTRPNHIRDIYIPLFTLIYNSILTLFLMLYEALGGVFFAFNLPTLFPFIFITISFTLSIISFRLYTLFSSSAGPGVGDNLSAVGVCLSLAEYFKKKPLKNTSLEIISFDGEEAGCQGSSEYYKSASYGPDVININIDGLYKKEDLAILSLDGNGLVKLDASLAHELSSMAFNMGYSIKVGELSFFSGSTDAASAAKAGIRSTTITAMAGCATPAHTENDTLDKIERDALEEVMALLVKFIESYDRGPDNFGHDEEKESLIDQSRKYKITVR